MFLHFAAAFFVQVVAHRVPMQSAWTISPNVILNLFQDPPSNIHDI